MPARLVNLTPHAVHVIRSRDQGGVIEIPPSGVVARAVFRTRKMGYVDISGGDRVAMQRETLTGIERLPAPKEGIWYIVSTPVAMAASHRRDLLVVRGVRRSSGRIIGCTALLQTGMAS